MKNIIILSAFAVLALTSATLLKTTTYKVDAAQSTFKWTGKKVTGSHWGYVKFSGGQLTVENNAVKGGSFDVDMTTMNSQDATGGMGEKLMGHLKSADFFDVAQFPKSTLVLKSVTPKSGNEFDVKADLTIKGITNEVSFPATIAIADGKLTAVASFNVNRTKYGIKYGSATFMDKIGDKAISDDFTVDVNLVAATDATVPAASAPIEKVKKEKKAKKVKTATPAKMN